MRRADLRQQLADLIVLLEVGCGYEHCVIKPRPRPRWQERREGLGVCICTPPDIAMYLRAMARAIKGYRWEEDKEEGKQP